MYIKCPFMFDVRCAPREAHKKKYINRPRTRETLKFQPKKGMELSKNKYKKGKEYSRLK